jgi:hypothetical protein
VTIQYGSSKGPDNANVFACKSVAAFRYKGYLHGVG